ncbi:alpha/beta hydrolase fold domain-containing protein [Nocardia sp. NPDC050712]|uniref:alpha/beta hydrolase n=1 Tax=Nocardia sp. NPDC050712 TaxID=3155518 RepID=UPI0033E82D6D
MTVDSTSLDSLVIERFGPASRRTRVATTVLRPVVRTIVEISSVLARPWNVGLAAMTDYAGVLQRAPAGLSQRPVHLADVDLEWVWHSTAATPESAAGAVLYFHGGAFAAGGLRTFRGMAARLSAATGLPVCMVGYRKLPARFPAIVADGVRAYRYLLARGFAADRLVCAGDSSGGCLAFAVPLAAGAAGLPLPGSIVAASPWTDFDGAARRESPNRRTEVFFSAAAVQRLVRRFLVDDQRGRSADAPVDADLRGLPPVLIQVGTTELLRCDAELMARRLATAGVPCRLQLWDRQPHGFPVFGVLPESRPAITEMARFIQENS